MESLLDLELRSCVKKLQELMVEDASLTLPAEANHLLSELDLMLVLLKNGEQSGENLRDVQALVYEAEDVVEEIVYRWLNFKLNGGMGVKSWFTALEIYWSEFKIMECNFRMNTGLESLVSRVQGVNCRLRTYQGSVKAGPPLLPPGQLGASGALDDAPPSIGERNSVDLENFWNYEENSLVGVEDVKEEVISRLVEEGSGAGGKELNVMSIVGMGGMGKTTLAKSIYKDQSVRRHFDCFAWAFVGQRFHTRLVFEDLLLSFTSNKREEMISFSASDLAQKLYNFLQPKRYLIVLDDVWDFDVWDCLCVAFPSSADAGSRVVLTTRSLEVAQMTASRDDGLHLMRGLNEKQSLELLLMTAFRTKQPGSYSL